MNFDAMKGQYWQVKLDSGSPWDLSTNDLLVFYRNPASAPIFNIARVSAIAGLPPQLAIDSTWGTGCEFDPTDPTQNTVNGQHGSDSFQIRFNGRTHNGGLRPAPSPAPTPVNDKRFTGGSWMADEGP